eukprot:CAMPEP_0113933760 /NCGR_PEP_ID=MMETSP1339-20121228/1068_1 /TAXON_ID=94617 /ORGANISM="Fibrocapsa japonica" /LENGTH=507 /DNA_ID=CAMNT_0000935219 /DNA_START=97 /DNA_END=1617 /DNA_ORIENTATION=- /assembly_acc=CAM_ASM_000762
MRLGDGAPSIAELLFHELTELYAEDTSVLDLEVLKDDLAALGQDWLRNADHSRFERELDEKYGMWKGLILHPFTQRLIQLWQSWWLDFSFFGPPVLSPTASVILLFMMFRAKQPLHVCALAAAIFFSVNPLVILFTVGLWQFLTQSNHRPRGWKGGPCAVERDSDDVVVVEKEEAEGVERSEDDDLLAERFSLAKAEAGGLIDHIVIGSDLEGLYTAALLSRLGQRVVVLESGPLVGGGRLVKQRHNNVVWTAECGVQTVGAVEKTIGMLAAVQASELPEAGDDNNEEEEGEEEEGGQGDDGGGPSSSSPSSDLDLQWFPLGTMENGFAFDLVDLGPEHATLVCRAGTAAQTEDLITLFPDDRKNILGAIAQVESLHEESALYFLTRMLPKETAEYSKSFVAPSWQAAATQPAMNMLSRVSTNQGLYAALWSQLRQQTGGSASAGGALLPSDVSFAAYVACMCKRQHGQWYPKGGIASVLKLLVRAIKASGGCVLTKANVLEVVVEG